MSCLYLCQNAGADRLGQFGPGNYNADFVDARRHRACDDRWRAFAHFSLSIICSTTFEKSSVQTASPVGTVTSFHLGSAASVPKSLFAAAITAQIELIFPSWVCSGETSESNRTRNCRFASAARTASTGAR